MAKNLDLDTLKAELAKLQAENASLKTAAVAKVSFKVSTKGAVSVYGLGRFPVTLYKSQWEALIAKMDDLKKFIDSAVGLSVKP